MYLIFADSFAHLHSPTERTGIVPTYLVLKAGSWADITLQLALQLYVDTSTTRLLFFWNSNLRSLLNSKSNNSYEWEENLFGLIWRMVISFAEL